MEKNNITKFEQLYNETCSIIKWAEEQGHINEDQAKILLQNITRTKEKIDAM